MTAPPLLPRLAALCTLPPPGAPLVCRVCHGPASAGYDTCWSCALVGRRLGARPAPRVVPVSLFRPGSPLHGALVGYKSSPDRSNRESLSGLLAELVSWFLALHGPCLGHTAGGGWDVIDVVPSTRRSAPSHPLADALASTPALAARGASLLRRGPAPLGHLEPAAAGFLADPSASGRRVLLLDDIFTTGARSRSAAAALQLAGAVVVAIVPVGRMVHTDDAPRRRWWAATARPMSGERVSGGLPPCCIEWAARPGSGAPGLAGRRGCAAQGSSSFPSRLAVTRSPITPSTRR